MSSGDLRLPVRKPLPRGEYAMMGMLSSLQASMTPLCSMLRDQGEYLRYRLLECFLRWVEEAHALDLYTGNGCDLGCSADRLRCRLGQSNVLEVPFVS